MNEDTPRLVERMRAALREHKLVVPVVRVSVADVPRWEEMPTGETVLIRWLCWNIEEAGTVITIPEFEVLHPDITSEVLRSDLPEYFPGATVIVDDDIDDDDGADFDNSMPLTEQVESRNRP